MALSYVAGFGAAAGTASVPYGVTAQAGDLILLNGVTAATGGGIALVWPAGFTEITQSSQVNGTVTFKSGLAYKIAAGGDTATGTWAGGSTSWSGGIYRAAGGSIALGATAAADTASATATAFNIPALTLQNAGGLSWVKVAAVAGSGTVTLPTASPASLTTRAASPTSSIAHGDTNGGRTAWAAAAASSTASASWFTYAVELRFLPTPIAGAGAAAGSASATAVGLAIGAGAGLAAGSSSAQAFTLPPGSAIGRAAGLGAAQGAGAAIVAAAGLAAGSSSAISLGVTAAVGLAAGKSRAVGIGRTPRSRILLGRLPSGAYGLQISEPGYDASADPVDPTRLYFSSEWPDVMPIHAIGSAVLNPALTVNSAIVQTINFAGLGYVPFVEFFVQSRADALPAGSSAYPSSEWFNYAQMSLKYVSPSGDNYLRLNVTATQLRLEMNCRYDTNSTFGGARSYVIYWVIYRRKAF